MVHARPQAGAASALYLCEPGCAIGDYGAVSSMRATFPPTRSKPLGNFIPKQPFNLTEFLSQPGKARSGGNRRFGNANFRPRPKADEAVAPVVEAAPEE